MKTTVTIDSSAGTFTHDKGEWVGTFPLADLPKWLAFYHDQRVRYPAHARTYEPNVRVLDEATRQLGVFQVLPEPYPAFWR